MPEMYQAIGGIEGCRKLSAAFYSRVARDPILRPIFPSSFHCAIEAFALFLAQFVGGPCDYSGQRWWLTLQEGHARFKIGAKERDAWLQNMANALDEMALDDSAGRALRDFFEASSAHLIGQPQPGATSSQDRYHLKLAQQWDAQLILEQAVAAVRKGDASQAIALTESSVAQRYFERDPAAFVHLLAIMAGGPDWALAGYARQRLLADPHLATSRYGSGRTLLHAAAEDGNLPLVELLLHLGADPNATDGAGHASLYRLGNSCTATSGPRVVRALVEKGADVNAHDGVKHCTALHMAARRGNVLVAEALLDCGANIEARDSLGETPLRRAVNCAKLECAALLLSHGADIHSKGSKGRTVTQAARGAAMQELLRKYA
jgi:truncated hemoglobin YjbI